MNIRQMLVSPSKYQYKCPYSMNATRIVVHNTANDASANNEIKYMISNNNQVSFHIAVDDKEAVQGIPFNRNTWHAGDGNGKGNREGLSIEICYSKSGGNRFIQAEKNAAKLIAQLLRERGWGIDKVTKHQDYSRKYCPHRTLDMGWERFLNMIRAELGQAPKTSNNPTTTSNIDQLARDVIAGKYGNGDARKKALGSKYAEVQARVNQILKGGNSTPSISYYPRYTGRSGSIVEALNSLKINSSFSNRSTIARKNGISGYRGTASQNIKMLSLLKQGKLIK